MLLLILLLLLKQTTIIISPDILISIIRVAAATLTTSSFLPEIIKRPIGPREWETRIKIPDMTVFATGTVFSGWSTAAYTRAIP
jgi:hypothetical protein